MTNDELIEKFESENLTLASFQKRGAAYVIDELLISVLFSLIYLDQMPENVTTEELIGIVNSLFGYLVGIKILYQTFFVWMYGATIGRNRHENPCHLYGRFRKSQSHDIPKPCGFSYRERIAFLFRICLGFSQSETRDVA